MEFYGALKLDNGRMDVSLYFWPGAKVVFLYDSDMDVFEMRQVIGSVSAEPVWAKVGEIAEVKKSGFVEIPEWILELAPGKVEKMLISPVYSEACRTVTALRMKPICKTFESELKEDLEKIIAEGVQAAKEKEPTQKRRTRSGKKPAVTTAEPIDLSEHMLEVSFGKEFDSKVGREDDDPLNMYTTDDF